MCKYLYLFSFFIILSFSLCEVRGEVVVPDTLMQVRRPLTDTIPTSAFPDSLAAQRADSSFVQYPQDSVPRKKKAMLDADVDFQAADSVVFEGGNIAFLYKNSSVKYKQMTLTSDLIQMNVDSSIVKAYSRLDSLQKSTQLPKFDDNGTAYESKEIRYNFRTGKGMISNVVTQQGEGYITGGLTKKLSNDDLCMTEGKYTTCDLHEHPHFYFSLTKAKVRPKEWIVTGPAYLVFADVPLPLVLPFGFFPFTSSYSSGILMPSYTEDSSRGFGLINGGYYFAASDYFDVELRGDIYTKGSWNVKAISRYRKRYKFSGNLSLSRMVTVYSEKGMPDYSQSTDFKVSWTHMQDPKANPLRTFSANVNFSTSKYAHNDLNGIYNKDFTQNTKSSSVSMTQRFANSPVVLSLSSMLNQRTQDASISMTLPDLSVTISSQTPFKRKNPIGKERWYEKIRYSYSGYFRNTIDTKENLLFKSSLLKDWRNGAQHSIPVSATFNVLKYISITPSFSYTERWYTNNIKKSWDASAKQEKTDTIWGFNRVYNYSGSIGATTKLYTFFKPLPAFGGKKVEAIRYMMTPTVSFSAAPDFGAHRYGYYDGYTYTDPTTNTERTVNYSRYQNGMFGTAGTGKQGNINLGLVNNLEMKMRPGSRDTTGIGRKISLIDNFTVGVSYNLAADSLNWSDINTSIRLKLTKSFTLNLSALFETYTYGLNENGNPVKVNVTEWKKNRRPGRLASTGTSFSYTINNATFSKKKDKSKEIPKDVEMVDDLGNALTEEEFLTYQQEKARKEGKGENKKTFDMDGYDKFALPWSLGFNYSLSYGKSSFNKDKMQYDMRLTHNLGLNGSITLTPKWQLSANGNFDFDTKKLSYVSCSVSRDLHCWQLSASFIPIGPYKSYSFLISIKSSMLSDVKYQQRSNPRDNINFF